MRSWSRPEIPKLPASDAESVVHLHDDATRGLVEAPGRDGRADLYVCGITPYDATHIGHATTYLAFDTLVRTWIDAGLEVRYTQNITDVDDPLLERAAATEVDWRELAAEQVELFRTDMAALRVIPPDSYVAVTERIDEIAAGVATLRDRGLAYAVPTPDAEVPGAEDLYFDIAAAETTTGWTLGSESDLERPEMETLSRQRGGDPDRPGKRDPLDPLLWRAARADEPSWDSVVGRGRPGWHIECAVIALDSLAHPLSVQGGGGDLVFPHHEFSAAHATGIAGGRFAEINAHGGLVAYQGEKMSKSLGNLVLVSRLRAEGVEASAIRLAVLSHHYRDDWEWFDGEEVVAAERLARWRTAPTIVDDALSGVVAEDTDEADAAVLRSRVRTHLRDDLDTPSALAEFDAWFSVPRTPRARALAAEVLDALLGIRL
ncbi:cysteine--1-D-myo-inosityl 2-amino-2-deoxy-alpha-D-glucopyranoside ligase [Cnuibacter physcomitrellae]|uniref:cysteine--1-D-myo-inosityl 2-amino-2-deoxy-alpha-D-glucopyranoside ligase n=1 Tax=Cnuibacter physcomitrellae TaxID=1619308 RepID=UPI0021757133|nr:cysteine--1-D-myo-inosityl 2-amino-2-deoxy-alpha-D-glucopyranoside ligase [Cnuibacter physcomitrellae]MCS5496998.1 cysteine--1-D-myo-inosityl 2-amino-2-deoxy-alpha-D-glucopyranoside ligase [Cnuibacter physcomitrellae]